MPRTPINLLLSKDEKKRLQTAAKKAGMALGTFIRTKALAALVGT